MDSPDVAPATNTRLGGTGLWSSGLRYGDAGAAADAAAELDELGKQINAIFGENIYNLWLDENQWRIPYQANVHGINTMTLPSGTTQEIPSIAGRVWLHEAWKDA